MPIEFHRDGPWELPEGWVWARAGDVLPLEYGKGLPERQRDTSGAIPVYGSAGIVGTHSKPLVDEPCLILARKGSIGAVFEETRPSWPIDTVYFARKSHVLDLRYAYWFIVFSQFGRLDQSTAVPSLSRDKYNDVLIPIAPGAEQRRIAARIDELFTDIVDGEAVATRTLKNLGTWHRALLKAAVTGQLTSQWRVDKPPNEEGRDVVRQLRQSITATDGPFVQRIRQEDTKGKTIDVSKLPELPGSWIWSRIGEVGLVTGGLTKNPARASIVRKLPYLRVANVQYGMLDLTDIQELGVGEAELDRVSLRIDDLLIVEGNGSINQIGRCALWSAEIQPCVHQNHIIKVRFSDARIAHWAFHWLMSPHGRELVTTVASSTSGLHTLSISKIEAIPIPICPLSEVEEILRLIGRNFDDEVTTKIELQGGISSLTRIRNAVLKAAFEGRLIERNPTDEPADILLTRLNGAIDDGVLLRQTRRSRNSVIAAE
ncbi:MAG: restriction endonuclease subunit S [Hyphomicrobiales bacterium]|nr:restriction endonuclease subunit S [Hyphomicrobiales bacterium]MBV8825989.1 restriction endonuclease subunit S [Hyphomicrobiales bacterium]